MLNGLESLPSQTLVIETLPELAPDAPGNFNVNGGQNQSSLDWDIVVGYGEPIGSAAASYNIYRQSLGSFSDVESISFLDNTSQSNYIDLNLDDNTYYCYAVAGVNSEGLEGEKSNLICTGTLSQLPALSPENLVAIGGDQQVFLSWNSSEGSPTIFYQIYRYGEYIGQTNLTNYNDVGLQKTQLTLPMLLLQMSLVHQVYLILQKQQPQINQIYYLQIFLRIYLLSYPKYLEQVNF